MPDPKSLVPDTVGRSPTLSRVFNSWRVARCCLGEGSVAYLPVEQLLARQSKRLQALFRHAWRHVPYYRDWMAAAGAEPGDLRCAADLRRLPLIDKLALTVEPERFAADGYERRDGLTLLSSGTSGRRCSFRYDAPALFEALSAGRRQRLALRHFVGREAGYREAVFNREGSVGQQLRRFWEDRMITPRRIDLVRRPFSASARFEDLLAGVNEFHPQVVRGYGTHLGAFFRWVWETGQRIDTPRAITYGADAMPKADRQIIERELGIPVLSSYQAVEALRIGFQCEARSGFHISVDQVAVRVIDPEGRDVAPGQRGELVITNLTNYAMPVIHYRLGDLVTLGTGPCPCGRTFPLISDIDGRLDDLIARPGGTWIHALAVLAGLQAVPGVRQVQVIQEDLEDFRLRVVWARASGQDPVRLRSCMAAVLGDSAHVRVEPVEVLEQEPSGKVKTVICKVRQP